MSEIAHISEIFAPSGCLTLKGMRAHLGGSLSEELDDKVIVHLLECEMCAEALGGVELVQEDTAIEESVAAIITGVNAKIRPAASKTDLSSNRALWAGAAAAAIVILLAFFLTWKIDNQKMDEVFSENFEPLPVPEQSIETRNPGTENGSITEKRTVNAEDQKGITYKWESTSDGSGIAVEQGFERRNEQFKDLITDMNANEVAEMDEPVEMLEEEPIAMAERDDWADADFDDDMDYDLKKPASPKKEMEAVNVPIATKDRSADKTLPYSNSGYNLGTQKEMAKSKSLTGSGTVTTGVASEKVVESQITPRLSSPVSPSMDSLVVEDIAAATQEIAVLDEISTTESDGYLFNLNDREVDGLATAGNYPREEMKASRKKSDNYGIEGKNGYRKGKVSSNAEEKPSSLTGMQLYQNKQYKEAAEAFEIEIAANPNNEQARLYGGISYLEADKPLKALEHLDYLLTLPGAGYKEDAKWYRSLALIKLRRTPEAEKNLMELEEESAPYRSRATKTLDQIRK